MNFGSMITPNTLVRVATMVLRVVGTSLLTLLLFIQSTPASFNQRCDDNGYDEGSRAQVRNFTEMLSRAAGESADLGYLQNCELLLRWQDPEALQRIARISESRNKVHLAELIVNHYLEIRPRDPVLWTKLGLLRITLRNFQGAQAAISTAMKNARSPREVGSAWIALASLQDEVGDRVGYETSLARAFAAMPQFRDQFTKKMQDDMVDNYWPQARLPAPGGTLSSNHPSFQQRVQRLLDQQ